jgi:hypothetical protein
LFAQLKERIQARNLTQYEKTSKLLDLGNRQKTQLEDHKKNEKSRQLDAIQARVKEAK